MADNGDKNNKDSSSEDLAEKQEKKKSWAFWPKQIILRKKGVTEIVENKKDS